MNHGTEAPKIGFADVESLKPIRVQSVFNPWLNRICKCY
jgi:hypothetical protein